jgi:phage tail-like protein
MRREEILRLLPGILQRTTPSSPHLPGAPPPPDLLGALLAVMEQLHAPTEALLADLHLTFHPDQAEEAFLPFLAHWVGLGPLLPEAGKRFPTGNNRLRDLVWQAVELAQRRGTGESLRKLLETALGLTGFRIEEERQRPFHFIIFYPPAAQPDLALVEKIVRLEKPAYTTYALVQAAPPVSASASHPGE